METISTRPQTNLNQKIDDWDSGYITLLPHHQPIRELSMSWSHTPRPSPLHCLEKLFPQCFWVLALHSAHLVPGYKCCTFFHHNCVSVDGFAHLGKKTEVWFSSDLCFYWESSVVFLNDFSVFWKLRVLSSIQKYKLSYPSLWFKKNYIPLLPNQLFFSFCWNILKQITALCHFTLKYFSVYLLKCFFLNNHNMIVPANKVHIL